MLLLFVLVGALAALPAGGRLRGLMYARIRGLWLPILAFLLESLLPALAACLPAASIPLLRGAGVLLEYLLLGVFVLINLRNGCWCVPFGLGALMNFAVIALNGFRMPVSAGLLADPSSAELAARLAAGDIFYYAPATAATRLSVLGDVLPLRVGAALLGFASVGDLFIGLGAAMLVWRMMRSRPDGTSPPFRRTVQRRKRP